MSAYYNENDKEKAAWLQELIHRGIVAQGEVDTRSISEVRPEDLAGFAQCHFFAGIGVWSYALRLAGWHDDRPVWTGSCPCPSFSAAGKGGGFDDPRHLWPDWARLIRKCRPATIFGEQADDAIGYGWLDLVQTDLERENYAVGKAVLGACSVGAPHIRQRLYFVANSNAGRPQVGWTESVGPDSNESVELRHTTSERGDANGLDHADSERCGEAGSSGSGSGTCGRRSFDGLEHASRERLKERGIQLRRTEHQGQSLHDLPETSRGSEVGDMADSDRRGQPVRGTAQREDRQPERSSEGDVGDAEIKGLEGHSGDGHDGHESRWFGARQDGQSSGSSTPNFVNGFWRDADWVLRKRWNSDDWEWCPAESRTQQMADGSSEDIQQMCRKDYETFPLAAKTKNRVLKLKGYGDAIVAPLAAEFIRCYMNI